MNRSTYTMRIWWSGGLSWLPVSFLLHVKYTLSNRIVWIVPSHKSLKCDYLNYPQLDWIFSIFLVNYIVIWLTANVNFPRHIDSDKSPLCWRFQSDACTPWNWSYQAGYWLAVLRYVPQFGWWKAVMWCYAKVNKNLATANRSRVNCAHNTLRASISLNITPWIWNLG